MIFNPFHRGHGLWKFSCNLLHKQDYIDLVHTSIKEIKESDALPVYSHHFIEKEDPLDLQFIIDDNLFLEMLLLHIREQTLKYCITQKQIERNTEESLLKDIEKHLSSDISLQALETKQKELQEIRNKKLMGSMMKAKAKWLHQGEKPFKFFL